MSGILCPSPRFQALDANGNLLVGGQLFSYQNGTTTLQATYTDSTLGAPNANPTILDARGSASIWLDPTKSYKLVLEDATGAVQWTQDNVSAGGVVQTNPSGAQTINGQKLIDATGFEGPIGTDVQYEGTFSEVVSTASTSKTRMTNIPAVGQAFSANLQGDGVTRDVSARWGYALIFDSVNGGVKVRCENPAGTVKDYAPRLTVGSDFVAHVNTGNVTTNSLIQRTLLGNTLGTSGGFKVRLHMNVVQGASTSSLFVFLGGIQIAAMAFTTGTNGLYRYEITCGNRGAANSQVCYAEPVYLGGGSATVLPGSKTTTAIDTTADCVLDIRVGNANNTDSVTIDLFESQIFSTFAM